MAQQNYQEETANSQEPTLRREYTVRRENLSGEYYGDREDFRHEETKDDAEARKDFGLFRDTSFVVVILNQEFNSRAERIIHSLFTRFTLLNGTPSRRKKAKPSDAKQNQLY